MSKYTKLFGILGFVLAPLMMITPYDLTAIGAHLTEVTICVIMFGVSLNELMRQEIGQ